MQKNIDPNNNDPNPIILNLNDKPEDSQPPQGMVATNQMPDLGAQAREMNSTIHEKAQEATTKMQGTAEEMGNNAREMFAGMSNKFKEWSTKAQGTVSEISDSARQKAQEVGSKAQEMGSKVQGSMTSPSTSADGDVRDAPKGMSSKVQDTASSVGDKLKEWGNKARDTMQEMGKSAQNAVQGAGNTTRETTQSAPRPQSPLPDTGQNLRSEAGAAGEGIVDIAPDTAQGRDHLAPDSPVVKASPTTLSVDDKASTVEKAATALGTAGLGAMALKETSQATHPTDMPAQSGSTLSMQQSSATQDRPQSPNMPAQPAHTAREQDKLASSTAPIYQPDATQRQNPMPPTTHTTAQTSRPAHNAPQGFLPATELDNTAQASTGSGPFSESEWKVLVEAPLKVTKAMIYVAPSGPVGIFEELSSLGKTVEELVANGSANPMMEELALRLRKIIKEAQAGGSSPFGDLNKSGNDPMIVREDALATCRQVGSILKKVPSQDAVAYKAFLYNVGQRVSEAAVEGGFMGIGGQLVSDQEAALLRDMVSALGR